MIANVRGALGGQVVSLLAVASRAAERDHAVTDIRINVAGVEDTHSNFDYLSLVFPSLTPRIKIVSDTKKVRFDSVGIWARIAHNRDACLRTLKPVPAPPRVPGLTVLHVRVGDRSPNSVETYRRFLGGFFARRDRKPNAHVVILGNDQPTLESVVSGFHRFATVAASPDPFADWQLLRSAQHVVGPRSYFALSAAMLDPALTVSFFEHQDGEIPFHVGYAPIFDAVPRYFPNVRFTAAEVPS